MHDKLRGQDVGQSTRYTHDVHVRQVNSIHQMLLNVSLHRFTSRLLCVYNVTHSLD